MLPAPAAAVSSPRRGGGGGGDGSKSRRCCVRVRRLLVSSLPASPFTDIACPTMLFFMLAFYALHGLFYALILRAPSALFTHTRQACPDLVHYAGHTCAIAAALLIAHTARVAPNVLAQILATPSSQTKGDADGNGGISASTLSPISRSVLSGVRLLLHLAQQLAWSILLLDQLSLNWDAYTLVNRELDQLKLSQQTQLGSALTPTDTRLLALSLSDGGSGIASSSSSSPTATLLCGSAGSMHLVRWSLVVIVMSTGLSLSLILVVAQDALTYAWSLLRRTFCQQRTNRKGNKRSGCDLLLKRCCHHSTSSSSSSFDRRSLSPLLLSPTASAAAGQTPTRRWLDLQSDEVGLSDADDHA